MASTDAPSPRALPPRRNYYDKAYDKKAAQRPGKQALLKCDTRAETVNEAAELALDYATQMVAGRLPADA